MSVSSSHSPSRTAVGISKLDIALLAGVARQENKSGQNMNLKWIAKQSLVYPNADSLRGAGTCADLAPWACICPSDLEVSGAELIRSPRSALAILRNGASVRDLVDSDLSSLNAMSRKAKLTLAETAERIALDRARRDLRRTEVKQQYEELCVAFSREEVVGAVRRFMFKGQAPEMRRQQLLLEEKQQQQQQASTVLLITRQQEREENQVAIDHQVRDGDEDGDEEEKDDDDDDDVGRPEDNSDPPKYSRVYQRPASSGSSRRQHQQQPQQCATSALRQSVRAASSTSTNNNNNNQLNDVVVPATTSENSGETQIRSSSFLNVRPTSPAPINPSSGVTTRTAPAMMMMMMKATASARSVSLGESISAHGNTAVKNNVPAFFSQLSCAPTLNARLLLKEEDVASIVARREREAARLRKRLEIGAGHRAARILQELKLVEKDGDANNQVVGAAQRSREVLEERRREAARRNELHDLRTVLRKQQLQAEFEEQLNRFDERNAIVDERVDNFLAKRKKRFDKRRFLSQKSVLKELPHTAAVCQVTGVTSPTQQQQQQQQPHEHQECDDNDNAGEQEQQQQHYFSSAFAAQSPQPVSSYSHQHQSQARQSSVPASCSSSAKAPNHNNHNHPSLAASVRAAATAQRIEIDDLLTEWRVQQCKMDRVRAVTQQARRREMNLADAASKRSVVQREAEVRRKQVAKRDESREQHAAVNKSVLGARTRGSVGLLARRIEDAQNFVRETDLQRAERLERELEERARKSELMRKSQARERRERHVRHLFAMDAADSWREQRKEREALQNDAKRVLFDAHLEDIDEDQNRRLAVQDQLAREKHLLRKTNHAEADLILAEEKAALVELGLRNSSSL